jgi:hypothetical protein
MAGGSKSTSYTGSKSSVTASQEDYQEEEDYSNEEEGESVQEEIQNNAETQNNADDNMDSAQDSTNSDSLHSSQSAQRQREEYLMLNRIYSAEGNTSSL